MDIGAKVKKNSTFLLQSPLFLYDNNQYPKKSLIISREGYSMTVHDSLKNIILLLIFIYLAPMLIEGIKTHYAPFLEPRTQIGILTIKNPLNNSYYATTQLNSFFKNPYIKGIVIKIDCMESSAGTSQAIFHEIQSLKKEYPKPIISVVENVCISGSYLIASACDYIIAPESALIGGIGSYCNTSSLQKMIEEKEYTNILHDDTYQQSIKQVATARKLSLATSTQWADGKIFTGHQAKSLGLVSATGSLYTAMTFLKEKALIEGEIELIEQPEQQTFYEILTNKKIHIS
jgi:protease IV